MVFDVLMLDPDTQKSVHHMSSAIVADDHKQAKEEFLRLYPMQVPPPSGTKNWLLRIHEHSTSAKKEEEAVH